MTFALTRVHAAIAALLLSPIIGFAQYGTAPSGYYPISYGGSTFKGVVIENQGNQILLTFTNNATTQTFTATFETGCSVPTNSPSGPPMLPANIPKGTSMTAFFNTRTKKVEGKKIKENVVIAIAFDTWNGHKIAEDKKKIYLCTSDKHVGLTAY